MPQYSGQDRRRKPDPKRSAAAKKAAVTRKSRDQQEQELIKEKDKWATWDKRIRDAFIFIIGLGFAINELVVETEPRPSALIFVANMIGVPLVLAAVERKRQL